MGMRILDLDQAEDGEIDGGQFIAIDDPSQSYKITLDQLKKFLGIGEDSILIPPGTDIYVYFTTAKSGQYYGENLTNVAQDGAWHAFDWTTHDQGRGTLIETADSGEMAAHALAGSTWTKKRIISESGGKIGAIDVTSAIRLMDSQGVARGRFVVDPAQGFKIINDIGGASIWVRDDGQTDFDKAIRLIGTDGVAHGRLAIEPTHGFRLINDVAGVALSIRDDGKMTVPTVTGLLSIGDSDTGIESGGDGNLVIKCNNQAIVRIVTGGLDVISGALYENGQRVFSPANLPSAGGIGDVALVKLNGSTQHLHGEILSGASFTYASLQGDASGQDPDIITETKTLSGTWRITGTFTSAGGAQYLTKLSTVVRIA